ncbi:hypothetical protein J6590_042754 [Homalodisca vitripennis]|nr:hypothetical protein J6590_042754 [Homalodisca vitripennis]
MLLYLHGCESILPQGIQHQVCTRVSYTRVPRVPPTLSSTPCCCIGMEVRVSYLKLPTRTSCTAYAFLYTMMLYPHGSESIKIKIFLAAGTVPYLTVYNQTLPHGEYVGYSRYTTLVLYACQVPTRTSCTAYAFLHTVLLYPHGSERILPHGIQHQVFTRVSYPRVPRVPPTPSSTPCCCIRMEVRVSYLKVYNIRFARVSATHAYLVYRLRLPPHPAAVFAWK